MVFKWREIFLLRGHLSISRDIFGCHAVEGVLLAFYGQRQGHPSSQKGIIDLKVEKPQSALTFSPFLISFCLDNQQNNKASPEFQHLPNTCPMAHFEVPTWHPQAQSREKIHSSHIIQYFHHKDAIIIANSNSINNSNI